MAILTGTEILKRVEAGDIVIDPFDPALVNVDGVSVDVRLGDTLLRAYQDEAFWPGDDQSANFETLYLPTIGYTLEPGEFYLAHTVEQIGSTKFVPVLHGKSTNARCSMVIHQTAGLAEPHFFGQVTCEITVTVPVRVWPGMRIAQVTFETVEGEIVPYQGRYQGQRGPTPPREGKR